MAKKLSAGSPPAAGKPVPEMMLVSGREIWLSRPQDIEYRWIGEEDIRDKVLAAWSSVDEKEQPMNPCLVGAPGLGKTTLAWALGAKQGLPVFIFQCNMDTRPEDLVITPVLGPDSKIRYQASPLATAVLVGGLCILDEGNRMREKAWASLAGLLDARRSLESQIAGIRIDAHPNFRFCATMNDDSSTYALPDYIQSRLKPRIELRFPPPEIQEKIIRENLPLISKAVIKRVLEFIETSHLQEKNHSLRDAVQVADYAQKLIRQMKIHPADAMEKSVETILGPSAVKLLPPT